MSNLKHLIFLLIALAIPIIAMLYFPPFAQPLDYHNFADQRQIVCVRHDLNVFSNLPFVIVGAWGMIQLTFSRYLPGFADQQERWPYVAFFAFIFLTGIGSAYYHADPTNARLMWDRLPLAMAFLGLVAIIIEERIDNRFAKWLFIPFALLGGGTVVYWHITETLGRGDLRPYFIVQFYSLAIIPFILAIFPSRYTRTRDLYLALLWYVAAKLLEHFDRQIYSLLGEIVSGHTLKHFVAAMSGWQILYMVLHRRPMRDVVPSNQ